MAESVAEAKARVERSLAWCHRIADAPSADATIEQIELMLAEPPLSDEDRRLIMSLVRYEWGRRAARQKLRERPHLRAMALLRSYLTPAQQKTPRDQRCIYVEGSAGGVYRLCLPTGAIQRVERRGSRWFWLATFCWHDYAEDAPDKTRLPLPDLALQQMLWLRADEPAFLASANLSIESRRITREPWVVEMRRLTNERAAAERPVHEPRMRLCLDPEGDWIAEQIETEAAQVA